MSRDSSGLHCTCNSQNTRLSPFDQSTIQTQGSSQGFNAIVDLCGVFKRSTIHDVRNLIREHFGSDRFHYVYHIGQADNSDRVLHMNSDNDVLYDEEFYRYLCSQYGAPLRERVFFFVDNRNVIGKGEFDWMSWLAYLYSVTLFSWSLSCSFALPRCSFPAGLPAALPSTASDESCCAGSRCWRL